MLTDTESIEAIANIHFSIVNGGSGGTGVFGIQIAKAKGCHVTTTCSTPNVDLCKSLGADEVIDYKKSDILSALKASGRKYDHVVDNVGHDLKLYFKAHEFTAPNAIYLLVGASISVGFFGEMVSAKLLPGFLGGGKRKVCLTSPAAFPFGVSS